jgi:hypothetical protein
MSVQCWTKVLRDRRFHLLSGPLCLTSDAAQRDTSGEVASHAIPLTPHALETLCASREAHAPANYFARRKGFHAGAMTLVPPLMQTAGAGRIILAATDSSGRRDVR